MYPSYFYWILKAMNLLKKNDKQKKAEPKSQRVGQNKN